MKLTTLFASTLGKYLLAKSPLFAISQMGINANVSASANETSIQPNEANQNGLETPSQRQKDDLELNALLNHDLQKEEATAHCKKAPEEKDEERYCKGKFGKYQRIMTNKISALDAKILESELLLLKIPQTEVGQRAEISMSLGQLHSEKSKIELDLAKDYKQDSTANFHDIYNAITLGFSIGRQLLIKEALFKNQNQY
jgi:hypothetical protein